MNAKEIVREMRKNKVTGKQIAENLGVSPPFVSQVINGHRPTHRVREAIASSINKPVSDLWPED